MAVKGTEAINYQIGVDQDLNDVRPGLGTLYKAVDVSGTIAANGSTAFGLVGEAGANGEHVNLLTVGVGKAVASAVIAAGARVTVTTSGYCVTATSGTFVVGRCAETAAVSGGVFTGVFNFPGATLG